MMSIKHLVDQYIPSVARFYRKLRDKRWFFGLREDIYTSIGLTLIGEAGQAEALPHFSEIPILQSLLADRDVFVDVGAHLGLYSCIAAKMGKYVIAVEPHSLNLQVLLRNFKLNELDRTFEVHGAALSDKQGVGSLFGGQTGGSLLRGWSGIQSNYESTVFINTLDRLLEGRFLDKRLVIKVDVEGNEHSVLLGAGETLGRKPAPVWTVEIGLTENFAGQTNPHYLEIFETFWSHGYRASALARPDQVVGRADLDRWLQNRKTDHGDINYMFVKD
jgi:FkbM family methyltransferase